MKTALLVLVLVAAVHADMYFHNPRGSNNRLDEARRDRVNANRLFDSQNNNRGGYNVGSLYYYEGSILSLEWTNQHSCADQNNHCEQIIQYMCEDLVRDGTSTNTIPDNPGLCDNLDCNNDLEYGMHEDFAYYVNCRQRYRNMGLFTADRNLQRDSARYTRQNNNGQRRGYECPEERDYYPYWQPTPWRDIVVFTNDVSRCEYYKSESENVKPRSFCEVPFQDVNDNFYNNNPFIPITQEECEAIPYTDPETGNITYYKWVQDSARDLPAPECVETQWSRDNHLGNTIGGFPMYYNWTIPDTPHEHCVLRIRYNISTGDYEGWGSEAVNASIERVRNVNVYDGGTNNRDNTAVSELDVASQFNFDEMEALDRGYVFRQNPVVKVFPDIAESANNFGLQLAINTNQFGRTFQDRSHTFAIRSRPDDLEDTTIYNLNVRGKRGNIVQVYPGVEYDFVPNRLVVAADSYVHIQWTGSNTNPNNNDGQGKEGTDRSNVVLLRARNYPEGDASTNAVFGHWGNSYPANLMDEETFLGLSMADRQALAVLDNIQFGGEMSELDDAGTYFDLGPRKVTQLGTYYYMCSRNNNFTNRSQKGKLIVQANSLATARIGATGGRLEVNDHYIEFAANDLDGPVEFTIEEYSNEDDALAAAEAQGGGNKPSGDEESPYVLIHPVGQFSASGQEAVIAIDLDSGASSSATIYRANPSSDWEFVSMDTEVRDGRAMTNSDEGGIYVASSEPNLLWIVGVVVAVVFIIIVVLIFGGLLIYFRVRPEKWEKTKDNMRKAKIRVSRSFAKQV